MALTTQQLQQKIKTIGSLKKVTRTMEMVSMAKMNRAIAAVKQSEQYARLGLELIMRLSHQRHLNHPFLNERKKGKTLLIVVGSDRGLCGAYHSRLERRLAHIDEILGISKDDIEVFALGSHAAKMCTRNKLNVVERRPMAKSKVTIAQVAEISEYIERLFTTDAHYKNVMVFFNRFMSSMVYKTVALPLLPISVDVYAKELELDHVLKDIDPKYHYNLEPNEGEVLNTVLPELINVALFQFLLEAFASEQSSRRNAMKAATDAAGRMEDDVRTMYNQVRQEAVTTEIIEIVNAGEALA